MNGRGEYGRLRGSNGPLARVIEGFESRREQQLMADWVGETLATRGTLAIEAGTGTGKTFAYLVPALLSGRQVIISTGTRTLQDQLFNRDLPTVAKALGRPARDFSEYVHKTAASGPKANSTAKNPKLRPLGISTYEIGYA